MNIPKLAQSPIMGDKKGVCECWVYIAIQIIHKYVDILAINNYSIMAQHVHFSECHTLLCAIMNDY